MRISTAITALSGFAAGALGTWLNQSFSGDLDMIYAGLLVTGGVAAWIRARKHSEEDAFTALDAWWVTVPAGMLFAFGSLRTDPLLVAALARWGTGALLSRWPRLNQLLRESSADPPAAHSS